MLEHGSVSRQHCWLGWERTKDHPAGRLLVADLGAAHGTKINKVNVGFGRIVTLHYRSFTLYHIH